MQDEKDDVHKNEPSKSKKWYIIFLAILFIYCTLPFSCVRYKDKSILVIAPPATGLELLGGKSLDVIVIGSYILETEYGVIKLKTPCKIGIWQHSISEIDKFYFKMGNATHNFIVNDIQLPKNVTVIFNYTDKISTLYLDDQEVVIAGVPFLADRFYFKVEGDDYPADAGTILAQINDSITLSDSTEIRLNNNSEASRRSNSFNLEFYYERELWQLKINSNIKNIRYGDNFFVKFPDEIEFKTYSSVTFKKNWGEIVESELFEEG